VSEHSVDQVTATVGLARYLHDDAESTIHLDLGTNHPGAHGGLELELRVDAGIVESCRVKPGLLHRSTEKLFEARDYRQIMMLANRHDWLSAVSSEIGVALAVEQATGIVPSQRATWMRMLLAEAGRIGASSLFLAALGVPGCAELRARWATWQEDATGGRVHPMITRIGGLEHPLPEASIRELLDIVEIVEKAATTWIAELGDRAQLIGLAPVSWQLAQDYACSGAVGQASGVDWDLRRDDPYLLYNALDIDYSLPVSTDGDAAARYRSLITGMQVSAQIIRAVIEQLAAVHDQPVNVPLPKTLRAPETTVHVGTQNPLGIAGWLLVSDGDVMPLRLKARTPSFAHLQAMQFALVGTPVDLLGPAVASFFFVVGDADR
jgi:NADH-quinone oxidoreductase subunit D